MSNLLTILGLGVGDVDRAELGILLREDIMGEAHLWLQDCASHELAALTRVDELDHLSSLVVEMSGVVVIRLNLELWVLQFSDVHSSGSGMLSQEVSQTLKVVLQVLRLLKGLEEVFLLLLLGFSLLFCLSDSTGLDGELLLVVLALDANLLDLLFSLS